MNRKWNPNDFGSMSMSANCVIATGSINWIKQKMYTPKYKTQYKYQPRIKNNKGEYKKNWYMNNLVHWGRLYTSVLFTIHTMFLRYLQNVHIMYINPWMDWPYVHYPRPVCIDVMIVQNKQCSFMICQKWHSRCNMQCIYFQYCFGGRARTEVPRCSNV